MVRLKAQEDNVKLKMNAPDGVTFRTNEYTPIMSGSSDYNELDNKPSINGHTLEGDQSSEDLDLFSGDYDDLTNKPNLFSGDYDDLDNKPSINGNTLEGDMTAEELGIHMSELINDDGYLKVTDLGVVDPEPYDDDVNVYLNTLTESGWYKFFWDSGDDYSYFAQVQSITYGGAIYVNQHCWGLEESPVAEWVRGFIVEDGEVVSEETSSYMTYESAINTFATKTHTHYRVEGKSLSVWDYCDGSQINMQNGSPILYTDTLNSRQYLIETWRPIRQPVYIYQKVTDLIDCSVFYQRSGLYQSGRTTWGEWEEYTIGGGGSSVFIAEYGVTSYQDILTALEDGKSVLCKYEVEMSGQTVMTAYFSNIVDYIAYQQIVFTAVLNDQTLTLTVDSSDTWADVWGTNVTDVQVNGSSILSQGVANLSNVAVSGSYNDLGDKPEQTEEVTVSTSGDVTYSLEANKIYHFTGQISSLTLTLVATSLIPHYHFDFVSGTTPAAISFGSSINWLGGEGLTPQSSMHYEVDILNGRGIFAEFPAR